MAMDMRGRRPSNADEGGGTELESELRQWPTQLKLLNPAASYFEDADLLVVADCVPFAFADFHRRFLKGKTVIQFCPKLDSDLESYVDKLAVIFSTHRINSISILRMEVPCCGGTSMIVQKALEKAGVHLFVKEFTISIDGRII